MGGGGGVGVGFGISAGGKMPRIVEGGMTINTSLLMGQTWAGGSTTRGLDSRKGLRL